MRTLVGSFDWPADAGETPFALRARTWGDLVDILHANYRGALCCATRVAANSDSDREVDDERRL